MTALPVRAETAQIPAFSFDLTAFSAVAERLETVLDNETEALQHNRSCDMAEVCQRKRQGLLELSRFLPRLANAAEQENARGRLSTLVVKLERNRLALDVQLKAVREIADIISRTIRDAESDGTYSLAYGRS